MALAPPPIDPRRYEDLVAETLARMGAHVPEYTNLYDSDPGVTLVQLFAFMTESLLYRADQIPERNRLKFLDLLGVGLAPAQPAHAMLAIRNEAPGAPATVNLAAGFEVRAGQVPFRADRGLDVLPVETITCFKRPLDNPAPELIDYYRLLYASWAGGTGTDDVLPQLYETVTLDGGKITEVDVVRDTVDDALWVAILARAGDKPVPPETWDDVALVVRKAIERKTLSLGFVPSRQGDARTLLPAGVANAEGQPLITYWLPRPPAGGRLPDDPALRVASYRQLDAHPIDDVLIRPGIVELTLPAAEELTLWEDLDPLEPGTDRFPPVLTDENQQARVVTWVCITPSLAAGARFTWVGANATTLTQRVRVSGERLEAGTGAPDQQRTLAHTPVVPGSVSIEVAASDATSTWSQVDDLYAAPGETGVVAGAPGPLSADVFSLDPASGVISFGDGIRGRRPPLEAELRASYDYSVGAAGDVAKGVINGGTGLPAGFKAENPVPSWGGTDAETTAAGEKQITRTLQHQERLVTAADFEAITLRTPGVEIGRVEVLSAFHPDLSPNEPGDSPGVVTLMLIPRTDPARPDAPEPDRLFLDAICNYLDDRRLVTTELVLRGPHYRDIWISVGIDVVAGSNPGEVRNAVSRQLRAYLAPVGDASLPDVVPVAGSVEVARPKGWPLRAAVTDKILLAQVARVPGVLAVNEVLLAEGGRAAVPQLAMTGLDLPRIAGLAVAVGDPTPLEMLRGDNTSGGVAPATVRRLPVPAIPGRC
jgi:hypothetical protein